MSGHFKLHRGDITRLRVDAIVNAANVALLGGGGVDGAIHAAAGPELVEASELLAPCPPGESRMTPGFLLDADYVIHTVGPVYQDGMQGEEECLRSAYRSALELASNNQLRVIAFPCISTGAFSFPPVKACQIAIKEVVDWTSSNSFPKTVIFCCFERSDFEIYQSKLDELGILSMYSE